MDVNRLSKSLKLRHQNVFTMILTFLHLTQSVGSKIMSRWSKLDLGVLRNDPLGDRKNSLWNYDDSGGL